MFPSGRSSLGYWYFCDRRDARTHAPVWPKAISTLRNANQSNAQAYIESLCGGRLFVTSHPLARELLARAVHRVVHGSGGGGGRRRHRGGRGHRHLRNGMRLLAGDRYGGGRRLRR